MTQDEALTRLEALGVDFSKPSISRLENGRQPYSEPILCAFADVYQCEPWDLISRHPAWGRSIDNAISQLEKPERDRIEAVVWAFLKAS